MCVNDRLLEKSGQRRDSLPYLSVTGAVSIFRFFDVYGNGVIMVINLIRKKPHLASCLGFAYSQHATKEYLDLSI